MIETIMSLEDEFDIEISDRDAETFKTVSDVIALVKNRF
jgi:acyl carrier protein